MVLLWQARYPLVELHAHGLRNTNREKKDDRAIDRAYQSKQIDNDYKAATSKVPDQKANDPWAAIRPAPSTPSPKKQ